MPIIRNTSQGNTTLEEFYMQLSKQNQHTDCDPGYDMLLLVEAINQMFVETVIWGFTSKSRLVLQQVDEVDATWYVMIGSAGGVYHFKYLMAKQGSPWRNAFVSGETNSLDEARKNVLIAMKECGAWKDVAEFRQLLLQNAIL